MACELIEVNSQDNCETSDGGIYETQMVPGEQIEDVTFDVNGNITNFTMLTEGQWKSYTYDDDDSAFYNQTGNRANKKITYDQQAFLKFAGTTTTKITFADSLAQCCNLVCIHRFNSGVAIVQGIDRLAGGGWAFTKQKAKATPSALSDTGAGEDRIEITIGSVGRNLSRATTLSKAAVLAL